MKKKTTTTKFNSRVLNKLYKKWYQEKQCSECSSNHTRIHRWTKRKTSDISYTFEQWYHDGKGGWLCYNCYTPHKRLNYPSRLKRLKKNKK